MAREALVRLLPALGHIHVPVIDPESPLPRPLEPGARLDAIAEFAVGAEFARRLVDVLRRRTRLWLEADRGRKAAGEIAPIMARLLGWSAERLRDEVQHVEATLWEEESLLERAGRGS
jgi:glycerol-3-phosphate dehydrogenase